MPPSLAGCGKARPSFRDGASGPGPESKNTVQAIDLMSSCSWIPGSQAKPAPRNDDASAFFRSLLSAAEIPPAWGSDSPDPLIYVCSGANHDRSGRRLRSRPRPFGCDALSLTTTRPVIGMICTISPQIRGRPRARSRP